MPRLRSWRSHMGGGYSPRLMPAEREAPRSRASVPAWILAALYAAVFSFFSLVKLRNYLYTDFDLAIFVQATNSLLHGSFYSSIAGLNLLGAHSALGLALIAPLFAIVRHPATLLVVQSVALGLGALPVHRL